jgi:hypothetical protein
LSQKTLCLGQKVWKKFGKSSESSETGFSECSEISEISEIVLFQNFQKLRKNDVKLELRKSRKTRSDSETDLKVRLKVWNAGPYRNHILKLSHLTFSVYIPSLVDFGSNPHECYENALS